MQQVGFLYHAPPPYVTSDKGFCIPFFLYTHSFKIKFSGLLRRIYIMLNMYWKIEAFSFHIWQNRIEKLKGATKS